MQAKYRKYRHGRHSLQLFPVVIMEEMPTVDSTRIRFNWTEEILLLVANIGTSPFQMLSAVTKPSSVGGAGEDRAERHMHIWKPHNKIPFSVILVDIAGSHGTQIRKTIAFQSA